MTRPDAKDYLQWERSDGWGDSNGGKAGIPGAGRGGQAGGEKGDGPSSAQTSGHRGGPKAAGKLSSDRG